MVDLSLLKVMFFEYVSEILSSSVELIEQNCSSSREISSWPSAGQVSQVQTAFWAAPACCMQAGCTRLLRRHALLPRLPSSRGKYQASSSAMMRMRPPARCRLLSVHQQQQQQLLACESRARTLLTKVSGSLLLLTNTAGVFLTVTEGPTQSMSMSPEPLLKAVSLKMQPPPERESEKPGPARMRKQAQLQS